MSIAPRETKCLSSCQRRSGQSRFGHLREDAPSGLTVGVSQNGQRSGRLRRRRAVRALDRVRRRRDDLRDHVAGAQHDHLVAGADVLAREVLLVVQRRELDRHAADVDRLEHGERVQVAELADVPVDRRSGVVTAVVGGNFHAIAQRGSRPTTPRRRCSSKSSTFTTTPSISKSSAPRRSCQCQALGDDLVLGVEPLDVAVDAEAVRRAATRAPPSARANASPSVDADRRSTTSTAAARRRAPGRAGGSCPRPSCAGS